MHIKRTVANAFALSAFLHVMPAMAGDTWDAYFLIVASIKAKPYSEYRIPELLSDTADLHAEYAAKCGVEVGVWHSDLVEGFQDGYLFVYTATDEQKSAVDSLRLSDPCSEGGYIKHGLITVPGPVIRCVLQSSNCD